MRIQASACEAPGLEQTAALFIGMPALLATAAVFIPTRSAKGVACKAVTIGLLISLIFLGEGLLCVLMTAPLFYAGGADRRRDDRYARRRLTESRHNIFSCLAAMSLVPMSLEGVVPITTIARNTVGVRNAHRPRAGRRGAGSHSSSGRDSSGRSPRSSRRASRGLSPPRVDGHTIRVAHARRRDAAERDGAADRHARARAR